MTGTEGGILAPLELNGAFCHQLQVGQNFTPLLWGKAEKCFTRFKRLLHKVAFGSKM